MRLLEITNDFPPILGGIENYALSLVDRWAPDDVTVLTRRTKGAEDFDKNLPYFVQRERVPHMLPTRELQERIEDVIRQRRIDVIHFATPFPLGLLGPRIRKSTGTPYAVTVHGGEFILPSRLPITRSLLRKVIQEASVLLPGSSFAESQLREFLGEQRPSVMVPSGVDEKRFNPDVAPAFGPGGPVIVSICRLIARKGPATLLRAMQEVLIEHPDAHLLIVGPGPDRSRLARLSEELKVADSITFAGPKPWSEIPSWYASGAVFAMPTRERFGGLETEGLPLVFVEASAMGLPSVAGRAGGVSDCVIHGETGFIVDGNDPSETARALTKLLDDPTEAAAMGGRARELVLENFTWDKVFEKFASALKTYCS